MTRTSPPTPFPRLAGPLTALAALALLAACGADGQPMKPGVAVSGEARVGVVSQQP
jgi:hypothetical protein